MRTEDPERYEPVEVENCVGIRETDKAVQVLNRDCGKPEWVPKSLISDDSEVYRAGAEGTLIVPRWVAEDRGWA